MGASSSKDDGKDELEGTNQPSGEFAPGIMNTMDSTQEGMAIETDADHDSKETIPTVFHWNHGGRNVAIAGTFNNWGEPVAMFKSGVDFSCILNLSKAKHAYKFYVDNEWRFAVDQPTVSDIDGNIKNFIDVTEEVESYSKYVDLDDLKVRGCDDDDSFYNNRRPDVNEYTKAPPPLPPHLRHIILNKHSPSIQSNADPAKLVVPQHVALNHLFCTAIKDQMVVLGITQRYKQKFVTTVFYSMVPS